MLWHCGISSVQANILHGPLPLHWRCPGEACYGFLPPCEAESSVEDKHLSEGRCNRAKEHAANNCGCIHVFVCLSLCSSDPWIKSRPRIHHEHVDLTYCVQKWTQLTILSKTRGTIERKDANTSGRWSSCCMSQGTTHSVWGSICST